MLVGIWNSVRLKWNFLSTFISLFISRSSAFLAEPRVAIVYPDLDLQIWYPKSKQSFLQIHTWKRCCHPTQKLSTCVSSLACLAYSSQMPHLLFPRRVPLPRGYRWTGLGPSATVLGEQVCHIAESAWCVGTERELKGLWFSNSVIKSPPLFQQAKKSPLSPDICSYIQMFLQLTLTSFCMSELGKHLRSREIR